MPASAPLTIIAISTAEHGQESALRAAQAQLVRDSLQEPGCLRYELHQSLDNGRILIFVESWASEEAWQAHLQGAAIARFQASGADDLIDDFALYRMALVTDGSTPALRVL
jgi:quinol monooxygenase YgiN